MHIRIPLAALTILAVFSLGGCLFSKEEKEYMRMVNRLPLEFELGRGESEAAWTRAQTFIARYSRSPLKIVTDHVIQTETTMDAFQSHTYYTVTRTPTESGFFFKIENGSGCHTDAHILAHYMQTGELPYPGVIGW